MRMAAALQSREPGVIAKKWTRENCIVVQPYLAAAVSWPIFCFPVSIFLIHKVMSFLVTRKDPLHASVIDQVGMDAVLFSGARIAIECRLTLFILGSNEFAILFGADFSYSFGVVVIFFLTRYGLHANLNGVEKESCSAMVDAGGGYGVDHLAYRDLDCAAVFEGRELNRLFGGSVSGFEAAMKFGVEEAVSMTAESGGVTPHPVGFDVTAFVIHGSFRPPRGLFCRENSCLPWFARQTLPQNPLTKEVRLQIRVSEGLTGVSGVYASANLLVCGWTGSMEPLSLPEE